MNYLPSPRIRHLLFNRVIADSAASFVLKITKALPINRKLNKQQIIAVHNLFSWIKRKSIELYIYIYTIVWVESKAPFYHPCLHLLFESMPNKILKTSNTLSITVQQIIYQGIVLRRERRKKKGNGSSKGGSYRIPLLHMTCRMDPDYLVKQGSLALELYLVFLPKAT